MSAASDVPTSDLPAGSPGPTARLSRAERLFLESMVCGLPVTCVLAAPAPVAAALVARGLLRRSADLLVFTPAGRARAARLVGDPPQGVAPEPRDPRLRALARGSAAA